MGQTRKYLKITKPYRSERDGEIHEGSGYLLAQPDDLEAARNELEVALTEEEPGSLTMFEIVEMDEDEVKALPEFSGW